MGNDKYLEPVLAGVLAEARDEHANLKFRCEVKAGRLVAIEFSEPTKTGRGVTGPIGCEDTRDIDLEYEYEVRIPLKSLSRLRKRKK